MGFKRVRKTDIVQLSSFEKRGHWGQRGGRELPTGPTEPVVWTKSLSGCRTQVILELWACWEDMRNILTQKAWLQIGGWSGWGSAFSLGYCWPPPWRSKVSWKGLLGSGGRTTCLSGLGGGEWLLTYSTAVPWHIRSAKVSFLDFKLCIESQSSEFSQTEGWVSSPCNLCETEARVKEKTVKREGKARGALGPYPGTPKGCQPDWSYLRESVQELVLLRQQTCAERPVLWATCPQGYWFPFLTSSPVCAQRSQGSLTASCLVRGWYTNTQWLDPADYRALTHNLCSNRSMEPNHNLSRNWIRRSGLWRGCHLSYFHPLFSSGPARESQTYSQTNHRRWASS